MPTIPSSILVGGRRLYIYSRHDTKAKAQAYVKELLQDPAGFLNPFPHLQKFQFHYRIVKRHSTTKRFPVKNGFIDMHEEKPKRLVEWCVYGNRSKMKKK